MDCVILIIKGFIIGIAKIIPGVSGALLAISLGLYEKAMEALSDFWKRPKLHFPFLMCFGFGVVLAIVLGSHVIRFLLENFYLPTMLLFIGLMMGGIPSFYRQMSNGNRNCRQILSFVIAFLFVLFLSIQLPEGNVILLGEASWPLLFLMGMIEIATTIIPGISGTAIFMLMGSYPLLLELFSMLGSLEQMVQYADLLIPFGAGLAIGIFSIAHLMTFLFRKYNGETNYAILGFSLASMLVLFLQTFQNPYSPMEIIISLILLVVGYRCAKCFD